jgi:hypothetical protein
LEKIWGIQMKFRLLTALVCAAFTLSACATTDGKLSAAYQDKTPIHTDIYAPNTVPVTIPASSGSGMNSTSLIANLAFAIVTSAIAANENHNKREGLKTITDAANGYDTKKNVIDPLESIVRNTPWLKVGKSHETRLVAPMGTRYTYDGQYEGINNDTISVLSNQLTFSTDFYTLTNSFSMTIYEMKDHKLGDRIYQTSIAEPYTLDEDRKYKSDNEMIWANDHGKLVKTAIAATTAKLKVKLRETLKNPYPEAK